jgi:hypothetical protein
MYYSVCLFINTCICNVYIRKTDKRAFYSNFHDKAKKLYSAVCSFCCYFADIEAMNLKKGMFFNPDPYVKMSVLPGKMCPKMSHHLREIRTSVCSSTTSPVWRGQVRVSFDCGGWGEIGTCVFSSSLV